NAIRIDGIGPATERPCRWWRHAIDNDVVHLSQITFAIKMSQGYTPGPGESLRAEAVPRVWRGQYLRRRSRNGPGGFDSNRARRPTQPWPTCLTPVNRKRSSRELPLWKFSKLTSFAFETSFRSEPNIRFIPHVSMAAGCPLCSALVPW